MRFIIPRAECNKSDGTCMLYPNFLDLVTKLERNGNLITQYDFYVNDLGQFLL